MKETDESAKSLASKDLESFFPNRETVISSFCPLFAWIVNNDNNYYKLIDLGLLEQKDQSVPIYLRGFTVLSVVLNRQVIFSKSITNKVRGTIRRYSGSSITGANIDLSNPLDYSSNLLSTSDISSFPLCPVYSNSSTIFLFTHSISIKRRLSRSLLRQNMIIFIIPQDNFADYQSKLTDLLVLGSCDNIVGTFGLPFSIIAGALQGNVPFLVQKNNYCKLPETNPF